MTVMLSLIMAVMSVNDRDCMEQIYIQYHKLMFSTAWKLIRGKADVDDVVSESCVSLMKNISTLRGLEDNEMTAYIVSAVKNTALNYLNKQRRHNRHLAKGKGESIDYLADEIDTEKKVVLEDELRRVLKAIKRLPIKEQQILRLKYVMEMSDEQIAKEVGMAPSSIRKYISRARKQIKAFVYTD